MLAGIYRHYKGGYYQVLGVAQHTETKGEVVVYISLSGIHLPGPRMRVRPLDGPEGFNNQVGVVGKLVRRFEYIGDELPYPPKEPPSE